MDNFAIELRKRTKYGPLGSVLLVILGLLLIIASFPNLFYVVGRSGFPPGMDLVLETSNGWVAGPTSKLWTEIEGFNHWLIAFLPLVLVLFVAAGVVRALRANSSAPVIVLIANLGLGIIAFPLVGWIIQIAIWVIKWIPRIAGSISSWINGILATLFGWLEPLITNGYFWLAILAVAAVYVIVLMFGMDGSDRKTILGIVAALIAAGVLARLDVVQAVASKISGLVARFWNPVMDVVSTVLRILVDVGVAVLLWALALAILGYLGSLTVTPLRDAFRAGNERNAFADVAAGIGVAVSTLIMAISYDPGYEREIEYFLTRADGLSMSAYLDWLPSVLDLRFDGLMPQWADPYMSTLFYGFNGTPDILVAFVASLIGIFALLKVGGRLEEDSSSPATIITMGFLRVFVGLVAVVLALLASSGISD